MANREQRRRKNKQTRGANTAPVGKLLNTKKIEQMADNKMIWAAMGIFVAIVILVALAFIWTAITV